MGNLKKWQTYSSNTSTTTAAWVIHSPTKHLEAARVTFSPTTRSETLVIYKTKQERVVMWRQTKINRHLWLNSPRHHSCLFNMTPQSLIMRPVAAWRRCSFHFAQHHTVSRLIHHHALSHTWNAAIFPGRVPSRSFSWNKVLEFNKPCRDTEHLCQ